jgi:TonB-dependent Receptor Plug Domain/Carboxypeptidase regulatory-like domain/TonB dependent receptor
MSPLVPIALLFANVEVAYAIETGAIQGVVEDESGIPVPSAEIILSGVELAGERRVTTPESGVFRFDGLSPGVYDLTVLFKGATIARAEVRVALSTTTNARIPAKLGGIAEEVEVVGFRPVVDTTTSAFSTQLGEDSIQNLPVGRSFQDVVNTIPGVSGRIDTSEGGNGDGNPSVRGEGQYGNNFLLDGVSIRDPATKTFGADVAFDGIENIQVYTDGAPAQYGQFTGMLVNVVTKDGGDEHHGSAAMFYSQHAWFDKEYDILDTELGVEAPTTKARFWRPNFAGTAGGPIIPEKLWYFTSLTAAYDSVLPEGVDEGDPITVMGGSFLGKLTWFPTDTLTLRYIFGGDYATQQNTDASQFVKPEATSDRVDFSQAHRLTAFWAPDEKNIVELRLGYLNNNINVVPSSGDLTTPARLDSLGVLNDNAYNYDYNDRNRYGLNAMYTRLLSGFIGDHNIKLGGDFWTLLEQREIINTGQTEIEWIDSSGVLQDGDLRDVGTRYAAGGADFPCDDGVNYSDCLIREHWTNVGPLSNKVITYSAFLQDDWQPIPQITANLGVRLDVEDGRGNSGERPIAYNLTDDPALRVEDGTVGPIFMPAPRLGLAIDPFNDGKTKFIANYGQYYDLSGNNFWSWSNTNSANGFVRFRNDGLGNFNWTNTQDPVSNPLIYASGTTPARSNKLTVGVEREVIEGLALGLRGILSNTTNLPEDVDLNLLDFYIMNTPPEGGEWIKERLYRGVELTFNKQFDGVWQLFGAYTLSESMGHTPGQFELAPGATSGSDGNNVGVYLDDLGQQSAREDFYSGGEFCQALGLAINGSCGWVLEGFKGLGYYSVTDPNYNDDAGWYGYLPYHAFHAVKLNGSYTAPFGTNFGLVYEFSSGNAWQKRTLVPFYGYDSFGQGRGSRFMPAIHYVDVRVAHTFDISESSSLEATLDVFNLPGFAQSITYFENDAPGFGSTLYRQTPRSVRLGLKFRY